jgi:hypothetical protein
MYLTIRFPDGRRLEGVLLAVGKHEMRVGVPDQQDVLEFRLVEGYWTAENGERIELESLIRTSAAGMPAEVKSLSAGGGCGGGLWSAPQR